MESKLIEYLLTSLVIKRAIQMANARNATIKDGAPRVEAADLIQVAIDELKFMHPTVIKGLIQTE